MVCLQLNLNITLGTYNFTDIIKFKVKYNSFIVVNVEKSSKVDNKQRNQKQFSISKYFSLDIFRQQTRSSRVAECRGNAPAE